MDYAAEDRPDLSATSAPDAPAEGAPAAAPPGAESPTGGEPAGEARAGPPALPPELPVLPVRDVVLFPGTVVPLTVGREKSKRLIDAVLAGDKLIAVCTQRRGDVEDPKLDDIYRVGTAAKVLKLLRMPDGTHSLLVHGLVRIGIEDLVATEPYWRARVHPHDEPTPDSLELRALAHSARRTAEQVIELSPNVPDEAKVILSNIEEPGQLADYLAANLSLGLAQKQELLETFDVADRLRKVNATLNNQLEVLQLSQKIQSDVREQIDKTQREYFLQQQLAAIRKELGEDDPRARELAELRERIEQAGMPEAVRKEAQRELGRLERMPLGAPEQGLIRDYLDWLIQMPWNRLTEDNLDLNRASAILEADHYGLEKIKRRILEYLAVRKLKPDGRGPILCFVGPPGVGKTSLGQSIAKALGRAFIRISLGGVRDEADIRGHRRTYIGAIPGRIVQELRKAGTRNPVLMLDELDKLGVDFRGDPAAALLEVLDPQQNHTFTDHYLGVPLDLSRVLFIATANQMDTVAPALRDRMEVIELGGYTAGEKLEIARRYLVPRQLDEHGLTERGIRFGDAALRRVIENYTRESGVRNLERAIGTVLRGVAARVARGQQAPRRVTERDLAEYLGPPRFERDVVLRNPGPGIATGLAYTPVGGDIIFIEAVSMPGTGRFRQTGQLGDVMRESAEAALTLLRARAGRWHLDVSKLSQTDIHVHVPAGGIPKDGPSAGVAMLVALTSLLAGRAADPRVAMTGEITLRGDVLPVGGIKEKVLAAHRAGVRTVVLPARNEPDLEELPQDVRSELHIVLANRVEDVVAAALGTVRFDSGARARKASRLRGGVSRPPSENGRAAAAADRAGRRRGRAGTRAAAGQGEQG